MKIKNWKLKIFPLGIVLVGAIVLASFHFPKGLPFGKADLGGGLVANVTSSESNPLNPLAEYKDQFSGFSFSYPKDFNITSFGDPADETGQTVLLQDKDGKNGLQVLVTPFDENITLTEARIKKDLPSLKIENAKAILVPKASPLGSVSAVEFESENSSMGKSLELWFVYEKRLYQISSPVTSEALFNEVIGSWK